MNDRIQIAKERSLYLQKVRDFFNSQDFLEVETPIMTAAPGMEPHLNPFETSLRTPDRRDHKMYLNTSPELQMKKLLGEGFCNIFNITKVFRNGEIGGPGHNPEFTMLEWYRTDANYKNLMQDCEDFISALTDKYPKPWRRISVHQLFLEHCEIELLDNKDFDTFKATAEKRGYSTAGCDSWDDIFFKIFLNGIEPKLEEMGAVIVQDYPASQAALAKKSEHNPFWAERFELYLDGIEIANAFSELIDPAEQKERLEQEQEERRQMGKPVFPIDREFLTALGKIKVPCAGIALGIDRLLMLLLDKRSIEDVLLFPTNSMI